MGKKVIVTVATALVVGGCLYAHRRVIKAIVTGDEMPKAPRWHVWVKKERRRG